MTTFSQTKPFLKWAGGKRQLIKQISAQIPFDYTEQFTYLEPFVGSGAILFYMLDNYPNMDKVIINDNNSDLINTYTSIKSSVERLIEQLKAYEKQFYSFRSDENKKKEYYYSQRNLYNTRPNDSIERASLFIFLNRTCFNGLYRVNAKNEFNVPIGGHVKPLICDSDNLRLVSKKLNKHNKSILQENKKLMDFESIKT